MQHDVFVNPHAGTRAGFPFIAILQADVAEGKQRIVAPMALAAAVPGATGRVNPVIQYAGEAWRLALTRMVAVPGSYLRNPVGTIKQNRDDITRAIDWLFTGV